MATPYHIVVHEGQPNHNLYFIHRGHVRVWKNFDDDTKRHQLVTLTIGDFFGEGTLLEHMEGRKGLATATVPGLVQQWMSCTDRGLNQHSLVF